MQNAIQTVDNFFIKFRQNGLFQSFDEWLSTEKKILGFKNEKWLLIETFEISLVIGVGR